MDHHYGSLSCFNVFILSELAVSGWCCALFGIPSGEPGLAKSGSYLGQVIPV